MLVWPGPVDRLGVLALLSVSEKIHLFFIVDGRVRTILPTNFHPFLFLNVQAGPRPCPSLYTKYILLCFVIN